MENGALKGIKAEEEVVAVSEIKILGRSGKFPVRAINFADERRGTDGAFEDLGVKEAD